jgi:hypothetical protein
MWIDLPPPQPAAEVSIATRGMSKGIAQTDGPQLLAKGYLKLGTFQLGGQWKNVTSTSADGEAALSASTSRKLGTVQLTGGVAYKFQTGVRGHPDATSWEFSAGASRKFGPVTLRTSAIYSPDDLGSARRSLYLEGGPVLQFGKGWTTSAAIGHRSRERGADYTAFNAGVSKLAGPLQLDLRYYDTDRSDLGTNYHRRVVAAVKLSL